MRDFENFVLLGIGLLLFLLLLLLGSYYCYWVLGIGFLNFHYCYWVLGIGFLSFDYCYWVLVLDYVKSFVIRAEFHAFLQKKSAS